MSDQIPIENANVTEFEFDGFVLQWVGKWGITFQDDEGEHSFVFDEDMFEEGDYKFLVGDQICSLVEEDFEKIKLFCKENRLF